MSALAPKSFALVNNLTSANHWRTIAAKFASADDVLIVSPFFDDTLLELVDATPRTIRSLTFVTRIYPEPGPAHNAARRLLRLLDWATNGSRPDLRLSIRNNPRLHGKIYIARSTRDSFVAVGSANCTFNGLVNNHEWSLALADRERVTEIEAEVTSTFAGSTELDRAALERLRDEAARLVQQNKEALRKARTARLELSALLGRTRPKHPQALPLRIQAQITVWLKPVGDTKQPIEETDDYWSTEHRLHFGKRPTGVKIGDLVIVYAVGHKKIVGLYEIVGDIERLTPQELADWPRGSRWPWARAGNPLTPEFSRYWPEENLFLRDLVANFKATAPDKAEAEKVDHLSGALQRKNDKIRLLPGFAAFAIAEIYRRNGEE